MNTQIITASVSAGSVDEAIAKAGRYSTKHGLQGVAPTGRVAVRSERHRLFDVELSLIDANVNDVWVVLTSYGIVPSDHLGSAWQSVKGVGC